MTASAARAAAERYVEAVNTADLDLMRSLFTDDAVLLHPSGSYEGLDAITEFYRDVVFAFDTTVTATRIIEAADTCVVEMDGRSPHGDDVAHVVDLFTVDDTGTVTHLAIYAR